ncbi:MAG TPA: hypothetical protein PLL77_05160 [Pyrinomonadaceae bacterium]|nr:hypothetical protein [Pyrinomonadaceae bacterium]
MLKKIAEENWFYILEHDDETDEYFLDVVCGTVGVYTIKIKLNDPEVEAYNADAASIKDLANSITNSPNGFLDRRV